MNTTDQATLEALAERLGVLLRSAGQTVATAESCTGGWVGQCLTAIPGSSAWYDRGFVTYSYASKSDLLGVPAELIATRGAVSEAVALAMADGALAHSVADWSVAITGIAGPDGGTPDKPGARSALPGPGATARARPAPAASSATAPRSAPRPWPRPSPGSSNAPDDFSPKVTPAPRLFLPTVYNHSTRTGRTEPLARRRT